MAETMTTPAGYERQRFILDYIAEHRRIRPKEIVEKFKVTKQTARSDILGVRAVRPGMLEFEYKGRSGWWAVVDDYTGPIA